MKIALFDPYTPKFTEDMVNWWRAQGHEVRVDRYYDPELVMWGDLIYFFTCDNNILSATSPGDAIQGDKFFESRTIPWDMHEMDLTGKKLVVNPIDIEVWGGAHAHERMWDLVDNCIFIAPHMRELAMQDSRLQGHRMQVDVIPFSINPDRWTFRERGPGFNIAVVAETWESKGIDYVLQIAYKLKQIDKRYHITYLGKEADYHWHRFYRREFIEENQLPITFLEWVESVDAFLDDKHYLLHASTKEAFSAATAEAAAKGIKPVLHAFGGYKPLWGDSGWVWQGIDEAVEMITNDQYDSHSYRDYLSQKGYTTDQMMQKIMEAIYG